MAGNVANVKDCSPLKQRSGLTGKYHAICHYSYNLPLAHILKADRTVKHIWFLPTQMPTAEKTKRACLSQR